jgi:hypothetical protein
MQLIQHQELSSSQSSIEFTSIPQTFTDLVLVLSLRNTNANVDGEGYLRFNSSTSGWSARNLEGNGSSASSFGGDPNLFYRLNLVGANATASTFTNSQIYIPNYAGATNKSFSVDNVTENNGTSARAGIKAGLWSNTSAITSIQISTEGSTNFVQYCSATLYGVLKGSDGTTVVS